MTKEVWKDIPGYEGYYQASNSGKIRSVDRYVNRTNKFGTTHIKKINGRELSQSFAGKGYMKVTLSKNAVNTTSYVHHLIYKTFFNQTPNGLQIDHIDENKQNNNIENLRVITSRENVSKGFLKFKKTSKYTGVIWFARTNKWRASIRIKGKRIHLGYFDSEHDAHLAYKNKLNLLNNK